MPLTSALLSSAAALRAFDQSLGVAQNNVANASTPGYVKQRGTLSAMPFDASVGAGGGVRAGDIQSSRNQYAEQAVRRQTIFLGRDQQNVQSFGALQSVFDISGSAGIPIALTNLFDSFSAWAQSPGGGIERQTVLDRAAGLTEAFHQAAAGLTGVAQDSERQIQQTVDQINRLAQKLQAFNVQALRGQANDPALDAGMHATLEELSQYADITALRQSDGSFTVLLNGQTPLVVADRQYSLGVRLVQPTAPAPANPEARPQFHIASSDGADVTSATTGGQLGALLDFRNRVLPAYIGDAYQEGDLNRMARQFASRVNEILETGDGEPLFTFDTSSPTTIAQSISVNPAITPDQLAAAAPGPPPVANGIALALTALAHPQIAEDQIDNASYVEFYGALASLAGRGLSDARNQLEVQQSILAQAKDLREQISGVSLDEEAVILSQFQRAYEANSRFITALDQLTRTVIEMLQ